MILNFTSLLCFALFFSVSAYGRGNDMGNGGDFVNCRASALNSFEGYYSLDYLLTYEPNKKIVNHNNYRDSLKRIQQLLKDSVPELYLSFAEFTTYLFNENLSKPRVWQRATFGVVPIDDEDIQSVHMVPTNCKEGDKIALIQAAVRLKKDFSGNKDKIFYSYMPDAIETAETQNPTQVSFILVHEWLWDHSKSVERNRKINRFLHSKEIESMSKTQVRRRLLDLGLTLPPDGMEPFYPNWCQSDEKALARLKAKDPWIINSYEFIERTRFCTDADGCLPWKISLRDRNHGAVSLVLNSNFIRIYPKDTTRGKPRSQCSVGDDGRIECRNWFEKRFKKPNESFGPFTGSLSDTCFQAIQIYKSSRVVLGTREKVEEHTEIVVFSRELPE